VRPGRQARFRNCAELSPSGSALRNPIAKVAPNRQGRARLEWRSLLVMLDEVIAGFS
jgi:hypothetical protein